MTDVVELVADVGTHRATIVFGWLSPALIVLVVPDGLVMPAMVALFVLFSVFLVAETSQPP